jgi:hypothetical protein
MHGVMARSPVDPVPMVKRYRLTAAAKLDERTRPARRKRQYERIYAAQVGHKLTKYEAAKVRRCASLAALVEVIETAILSGDERGTFCANDLVRM